MDPVYKLVRGDVEIDIPETLPVLPIRDMVVFPNAVIPLLVGRERSLAAVEEARDGHSLIMVITQKDSDQEAIQAADIHRVGTICQILQILDFPNGHSKVVVEGLVRGRIKRFLRNPAFFNARVEVREDPPMDEDGEGLIQQLMFYFQEYISYSPELPEEMVEYLQQQSDVRRMMDFVAVNVQLDTDSKQRILQEDDPRHRLALLLDSLRELIGHQRVRQDIDQRVQESLLKNQRNYYLQEKLKVINRELGEEEESSPEIYKLEEDILSANMPDHALDKATEELGKLKKIPAFSPEYTVIRNYLDWMIQVPWQHRTADTLDIARAQKILDDDHFGLEKPKERILEHLAVLKRVRKMKGPILCLVGPPGVGKTSLGRSVARALGREFVRISLGGVRDEAEIRGHRRTYIGSMPGKIVQSMKKAGSVNPVFLLDEVDKMSMDYRGDPSAALLEVLDPEQNRTFNDHYLDVDYNLSEVFFITTANVRGNIPLPLQDRMEIIELPGYLEHEKINIARLHLIPKQLTEHGLGTAELVLEEGAILRIIREYTREAGVRNLERQIATLSRKVVRRLAERRNGGSITVTADNLSDFLGKPEFLNRRARLEPAIGIATGLAWTAYGGELLKIEVNLLPGKGKLTLTGKLGDVMQESAQAALSYIRSIAGELGIDRKVFEEHDIHVHVPEGAVPKDGPSAGVSLASAIISALTATPMRNDIAMTGEITLRGSVLAVGGINEKLLAAQRNGIAEVIVPEENAKEVADLPQPLREGLTIHLVSDYEQVRERVMTGGGKTKKAPGKGTPRGSANRRNSST